MNRLKFIKSTLIISLGAVLLGSCMKSEDPGPPIPAFFMTIFNGYPGETGVMPRIDNTQILADGSLGYAGTQTGSPVNPIQFSSEWFGWTLGEQSFSVRSGNNQEVLVPPFPFTTEDNKLYTWLVYGEPGDVKSFVVEDEFLPHTEQTPKIRFFNLANGTGEVELLFDGEVVPEFSERDQETASSATSSAQFRSKTVSENGTTITINDTNGTELDTHNNYPFDPQLHYTIVLVGNPAEDPNDPESESSYEIKVFHW